MESAEPTNAPTAASLKRPRVLILTASTGNGHTSAARAVELELKSRGLEVLHVDALDYAPYAFRQWYRGGYEVLVRNKPDGWAKLYDRSDKPKFEYRFQSTMDLIFQKRLRKLIAEFKPDWVLCTHSLPQPALAWLRKKKRSFRIGIVVTDMYPHLMWLRGAPDHFFVPSDWSKNVLEKRLPACRGQVTVTGIPIDPIFGDASLADGARARMGMREDLPLLILTSGGIGGGPIAGVVRELGSLEIECQILVVCGRNEAAFRRISEMVSEGLGKKVHFTVKGLVTQAEMAEMMHACDMLISKPGGLTTSEALASGTPFVVYSPFLIPGQEIGNREFLVEKGAGVAASNPAELLAHVRDLLQHPEKLAEMRAKALPLGMPRAAANIVDTLLTL